MSSPDSDITTRGKFSATCRREIQEFVKCTREQIRDSTKADNYAECVKSLKLTPKSEKGGVDQKVPPPPVCEMEAAVYGQCMANLLDGEVRRRRREDGGDVSEINLDTSKCKYTLNAFEKCLKANPDATFDAQTTSTQAPTYYWMSSIYWQAPSKKGEVEVAPNFGVNLLSLHRIRHGKLSKFLANFLNPFNVASRVSFRAAVDTSGVSEIDAYLKTDSCAGLVAFGAIGTDNCISLFFPDTLNNPYTLRLTGVLSCFAFLAPDLLITGSTSGEIELWRVSREEAKCLYEYKCAVFPIHFEVNTQEDSFCAILSKGKCMLRFDSIACVSGNTNESLFSPVIIDLLQPQPILDCASFKSCVASLSGQSPCTVHVTDWTCHSSASWTLGEDEAFSRIFYNDEIGHLFALPRSGGAMYDCAWTNGLVGVSTMPASNCAPNSIEKISIALNPLLVDLKHSKLVTVLEDKNLVVYALKKSGSLQFPTSPIISEFALEKQLPISVNSESVVGITISDSKNISIVVQDQSSRLRVITTAL